MTEIKLYSPEMGYDEYDDRIAEMIEYSDGEYVKYSDVEKLQARIKELEAELSRYSMSAGAACQHRAESQCVGKHLGFDENGIDIAPIELIEVIDRLKKALYD